jgi:hypothetical protein
MRAIKVRELNKEERAALEAGLRSSSAFRVRRSQILLMSADKRATARVIGESQGCSDQCVREAIHAFEKEGIACLEEKTHARKDEQGAFDEAGVTRLKELVKLSPRSVGHEASLWTRELLAQQCYQEKLTEWLVSGQTISNTLKSEGIAWRRAKHWIKSPDPQYEGKKTPRLAESTGPGA